MAHVIILVGGLATRLYPITKDIPKCLVPCPRPFVDYQLAWLAATGVSKATFVLGHYGEQVEAHLQNLKVEGLAIDWILEGKERLGTGGAVQKAINEKALKEFLIVYGDSFMPTSSARIWEHAHHQKAQALMTVFHNEGRYDSSNVHFLPPHKILQYSKDPEVQKRENFQHIDYGISYWQSDFFTKHAPQKPVWDLAALMTATAASGQMHGLEVKERFYEIGSQQGYQEFKDLIEGKIDRELSSVIHSYAKRLGS